MEVILHGLKTVASGDQDHDYASSPLSRAAFQMRMIVALLAILVFCIVTSYRIRHHQHPKKHAR